MAASHIDNAGVLNDALEQFRQAAASWQDMMMSAASQLFWALATISLVWTLGQLALRRADLGEFFGELVRFSLFTGFWSWMLTHAPEHAQQIMKSMQELGAKTNGSARLPSDIVDMGFHVLDVSLEQMSLLSPVDSVVNAVLGVGVAVVMALIAANLVVVLVALWCVAYIGLFVVGFGAAKWTNDMAINYYRTVLSLALQALSLILLTGVGQGLIRSYYDRLDADVSLHEQAVVLVVGLILLNLVNRVPPLIGGLVSGASPQHAIGHGPGPSTALVAVSTALGASRLASEGAVAAGRTALAMGAGAAAAASGSLLSAVRGGARDPDFDVATSGDASRHARSSEGGSVFAMPAPSITPSPEAPPPTARPSTPTTTASGDARTDSNTRGGATLDDTTTPARTADGERGVANDAARSASAQDASEANDADAFTAPGAPRAEHSPPATAVPPEVVSTAHPSNPTAQSNASSTSDPTSSHDKATEATGARNEPRTASAGAALQAATQTALAQTAPPAPAVFSQMAVPPASPPTSNASAASTASLPVPPPAGLAATKGTAQSLGQATLQGATGMVPASFNPTPGSYAPIRAKIPALPVAPNRALAMASRVQNSVSAGVQAVDVEAEISAFRDRD